jgi:preprotein translocase subunit SecE
MNILNKVTGFLNEVKVELSKVSWSTRQELVGSTIVVIMITLIMGLFIGLLDLLLSQGLSLLFK